MNEYLVEETADTLSIVDVDTGKSLVLKGNDKKSFIKALKDLEKRIKKDQALKNAITDLCRDYILFSKDELE